MRHERLHYSTTNGLDKVWEFFAMEYYDFWSRLAIAPNAEQIRDAAIRRTFPTVFEKGWMRTEKVNPVRLLLDMFAYRDTRNSVVKQKPMVCLALSVAFVSIIAFFSLPPYSTADVGISFLVDVAVICGPCWLAAQSVTTLRRPIALMPRDGDFKTAITFCYELHHFLTDLHESTVKRFWEGGLSDEMIREGAAKVLTAEVSAMLAAKREKEKSGIMQLAVNVGESHLKNKFDSYKRLGLLGQDETYKRFYRRAQREARAVQVA